MGVSEVDFGADVEVQISVFGVFNVEKCRKLQNRISPSFCVRIK